MNGGGRLLKWNEARRILCVRLDSMGDVLMSTPAMRALVQSCPDRRITLLTSASGAAIAQFIDEIDDVIEYNAPWMKINAVQTADSDLAAIAALRSRAFDAAVIFTSYSQSPLPAAYHCHLAGIPLRLAHSHENPYHLLSDWIADPEPAQSIRHEVRRQLDLVEAIGCRTENEHLSLTVRDDDLSRAQLHLHALGIDLSRPWVLLHPGASAPSRRYPVPLWADVVERLGSMKIQLVLSGSGEELVALDDIRRQASNTSTVVAGETDLGLFNAIVSMASLLVTNNTGPVHIASALGTPVVDLYALTNPQHTPWQVPSQVLFEDVPCAFCYKSECPMQHQHCLSKVSPERVTDAVMKMMTMMEIISAAKWE